MKQWKIYIYFGWKLWLPWWLNGKESAYKEGDKGLIPGSGRFPQSRNSQPTPVFLPIKSHGQRSLAGYSPRGSKRVGHDQSNWATRLSSSHYFLTIHFLLWQMTEWVKVAQLCPTLCDTMGYTVHGILQARILEWVAIPFPRGSSQPRDWTQVSCIAGGFFTSWTTRKAQQHESG